jgi:hypothetical protein
MLRDFANDRIARKKARENVIDEIVETGGARENISS